MTPGFSLSLDLIRIFAAMVVFVAHFAIPRISGDWLQPMDYAPYAHHAVVVFFVLSGLVMAYVVSDREDTPGSYFRARLVRLYSVVLPMMVLVPVLDWIGRASDPLLYDWSAQSESPVTVVLTAISFLHESWWISSGYFTNAPYWSIAKNSGTTSHSERSAFCAGTDDGWRSQRR